VFLVGNNNSDFTKKCLVEDRRPALFLCRLRCSVGCLLVGLMVCVGVSVASPVFSSV